MNINEINFIKQDVRDLQKKLDAILKRLVHVEANTVPVENSTVPVKDSKDCECRGEGPCQCE